MGDSTAAVLGICGYALLCSGEQIAVAAGQFDDIDTRVKLLSVSAHRTDLLQRMSGRLAELGVVPSETMALHRSAIDEFHQRTPPRDGLEMLIKIAVTEQLAAGFLAELAAEPGGNDTLDAVVGELRALPGELAIVSERVIQAIDDDPAVAGRLALWSRRLLGEALSQAQRLLADHEELAVALWPRSANGTHLATLSAVVNTLVKRHDQQMRDLKLSA